MLEVTFAGWAATIGLIAALFLLDLFVSRPGHAHTVGFREAVVASLFYVGVAVGFGGGVRADRRLGLRQRSTSPATSSRRASPSTTCSSSS